jgi:hypothetical protein
MNESGLKEGQREVSALEVDALTPNSIV